MRAMKTVPWVVAVLLAEALESALVEVVAVAPERKPVVDVVA